MVPELGHFALILALLMAIAQGTLPIIGAHKGVAEWMALARPAAQAQFVFVVFAWICLVISFVSDDFSVINVAQNGNTLLPMPYKIAASWGSHEGSMLLWLLMLAGAAVLNPGDEVIILDPSWVSYEPCVLMAGGKPVHHPVDTRTFRIDEAVLEKVTQKTRMVVVNSPSNPSGAVLDRSSMNLLADMCEDYDLFALSDEIYEKLIYGREHISLASIGDMAQRTSTVNGFSKAYAMTGWRLGWAVAPQMIIHQMSKVQQHSISHPTTFAMYGGVAALTSDQSCVETMRKEFNRRRDYLV